MNCLFLNLWTVRINIFFFLLSFLFVQENAVLVTSLCFIVTNYFSLLISVC